MKIFKGIAIIFVCFLAFVGVKNLYDGVKGSVNAKEDIGTIVKEKIYGTDDTALIKRSRDNASDLNEVASSYVSSYISSNGFEAYEGKFPKVTVDVVENGMYVMLDSDVGFLGAEEEKAFIQNLMNELLASYDADSLFISENGDDYESDNLYFSFMFDIFSAYSEEGMARHTKRIEDLKNSLKTDGLFVDGADQKIITYFYNVETETNESDVLEIKSSVDPQLLYDTYRKIYKTMLQVSNQMRVAPAATITSTEDSVRVDFGNYFIGFSKDEEMKYIQNVCVFLADTYDYEHVYVSCGGNDYVSDYFNIEKDADLLGN